MSKRELQRKETLLLETLLSGLDARESARIAEADMLLYLADLLIQSARDELQRVRESIEAVDASNNGADA